MQDQEHSTVTLLDRWTLDQEEEVVEFQVLSLGLERQVNNFSGGNGCSWFVFDLVFDWLPGAFRGPQAIFFLLELCQLRLMLRDFCELFQLSVYTK